MSLFALGEERSRRCYSVAGKGGPSRGSDKIRDETISRLSAIPSFLQGPPKGSTRDPFFRSSTCQISRNDHTSRLTEKSPQVAAVPLSRPVPPLSAAVPTVIPELLLSWN